MIKTIQKTNRTFNITKNNFSELNQRAPTKEEKSNILNQALTEYFNE